MFAKRLFLLVSTFLIVLGAGAATVEDRSPFRQGHWWDPTRSGHGFEILNAGGNVMVVWYTYDNAGAPTWYTAQGTQESLGTTWPLQKHRWFNGRIVASTDVGTFQLRVDHFERIAASWQLDGVQQTWLLDPFVQSGMVNEVDLTGHWYDTANSGWGMTLLDQGDVFGAVIYAYDPAGQPTWVAGFDRGKYTRIDLYKTRGTCPACPYRAITNEPAGAIDIGYNGDTQATVRGAPTVAFAPDLRINGAQISQLGRPASTRRGDYQLASFARAETLKAYLIAGMSNRRFATGGIDFSASPAAGPASFSTTNTQEVGVDEADVIKTDGRIVFSIATATTVGLGAKVRIVDVGPGGSLVQPIGEFHSYQVPNAYSVENGLYLHAGNLVTLGSNYYYGGWYISSPEGSETLIEILDVANPSVPTSRWRARLSGSMVSSRRIGDRMYVVTRFTPSVPGYSYANTDAARAANAALLAAAPLESLLPKIRVNEAAPTPILGASSVHAPQLGGKLPVADMVVVTVIDIRAAQVVDALAIVGQTEAIYVSPSNLYIASTRYNFDALALASSTSESLYNTDIHQVAIGGDRLRLVGSGSIEGMVGWGDKASFRFGEHGSTLAVVTSLPGRWWGDNSNRVTILEPSAAAPGLLRTVSHLPNSARPEPLGKPRERLYGTRFVGDKLYAVTFMQVDPLYIVDLANKSDPKITGALELPGFSDYLHPLPNGLMLGFGRDATSNGLFQGLQMTLFDVSGATPRLIEQVGIGKRGSDSALFGSHRAFSALARADGSTLVAFPAAIHDGTSAPDPGAWYPWDHSGLLRFEVRGTTPADARLVQSRTLVTERATAPSNNYYGNGSFDMRTWTGRGRSVLFPDASIFVGSGGVWRMDNRTGDTIGPY